MKRKFLNFFTSAGIILALVTMVISCKKDISSSTKGNSSINQAQTTVPRAVTWQLVWSDEFNGTGVDGSKWNIDVGNPNVNNEKEYYQAANVTESNGNLVITARQESVGGQPYTSAKLNTSGKFSMQYGRIEARIQLPMVTGTWPAFWMLGTNIGSVGWPTC